MGRVYLMREIKSGMWHILSDDLCVTRPECNVDSSAAESEVIYAGDSLSEILNEIQRVKNDRFFVVFDWIDSKGRMKRSEYPWNYSINVICGFIPEVLDIHTEYLPHRAKWEVDFVGELWVLCNDEAIREVKNFRDVALKEVADYIIEHGLKFEFAEGRKE